MGLVYFDCYVEIVTYGSIINKIIEIGIYHNRYNKNDYTINVSPLLIPRSIFLAALSSS